MHKSARMVRRGVIVILDGKQRKIKNAHVDGDRVVLECEDGTSYHRPPNAKIEVIKR